MWKMCAASAALFVSAWAGTSATAGGGGLAGGDTWNGLYVGGHAGWARGGIDWTYLSVAQDLGGPQGSTEGHSHDGWLGGVQLGYQRRFDRLIAGIEVSYSGGDFFGSRTSIPSFDVDESVTTELGSLFTAAARLGIVLDPRFMVYAKAGYATANLNTRTYDPTAWFEAVSASARSNERHGGWMAGAGIEYALAPNLTLGLDYTYIHLGAKRHSMTSLASDSFTYPYDLRVEPDPTHAVSLRLNFRLGGHDAEPSGVK